MDYTIILMTDAGGHCEGCVGCIRGLDGQSAKTRLGRGTQVELCQKKDSRNGSQR